VAVSEVRYDDPLAEFQNRQDDLVSEVSEAALVSPISFLDQPVNAQAAE
jgi:hypothetical protein